MRVCHLVSHQVDNQNSQFQVLIDLRLRLLLSQGFYKVKQVSYTSYQQHQTVMTKHETITHDLQNRTCNENQHKKVCKFWVFLFLKIVMREKIWSIQERPALKPFCVSDKGLFKFMWLWSRLFNTQE